MGRGRKEHLNGPLVSELRKLAGDICKDRELRRRQSSSILDIMNLRSFWDIHMELLSWDGMSLNVSLAGDADLEVGAMSLSAISIEW